VSGPVRVLYLYCHPLPESFHAAILAESLAGLKAAGHEVDLLDLYKEAFDPVLSAGARRDYHDTSKNRIGLENHIARLQKAEVLVLQFPTWTFGLPAMLKGYLDRMLMPGVAFDLTDPANVTPMLGHIRRIVGISTYGRPRWTALYVGDPPRKAITRYLPRLCGKGTKADYYGLYHMNVATDAQRKAFMAKVRAAMTAL
jgi:NAD(P)H dehydrogenase (quinone)